MALKNIRQRHKLCNKHMQTNVFILESVATSFLPFSQSWMIYVSTDRFYLLDKPNKAALRLFPKLVVLSKKGFMLLDFVCRYHSFVVPIVFMQTNEQTKTVMKRAQARPLPSAVLASGRGWGGRGGPIRRQTDSSFNWSTVGGEKLNVSQVGFQQKFKTILFVCVRWALFVVSNPLN